jgi:hypothetical protein
MDQVQDGTSASLSDGLDRATPDGAAAPAAEAGERPASWRIEVKVNDSGEWEGDPYRFETVHEALAYARDIELQWSAVRDRRVVKSQDPVNHRWPAAAPAETDELNALSQR